MENNSSPSYAVPVAIIIAGLFVAGAVYYKGPTPSGGLDQVANVASGDQATLKLENLRPVGPDDHILGDPNAPIKIVEYSDLECPFCKSFHQTMNAVMQDYGSSGQVAWIFRHFPLDQLHAKARKEAEATECANELGGNSKFWEYTDKLFSVTPSNDQLDPAQLPLLAEQIGLDKQAFDACLASGRQAERVDQDYQNAIASGGNGTPFPIIITPDNQQIAIAGAVPIEGMRQLINGLLEKK
ncbi:MAG: thioredoxin domain-containing protein [Patescibacteria group bacterium]